MERDNYRVVSSFVFRNGVSNTSVCIQNGLLFRFVEGQDGWNASIVVAGRMECEACRVYFGSRSDCKAPILSSEISASEMSKEKFPFLIINPREIDSVKAKQSAVIETAK